MAKRSMKRRMSKKMKRVGGGFVSRIKSFFGNDGEQRATSKTSDLTMDNIQGTPVKKHGGKLRRTRRRRH